MYQRFLCSLCSLTLLFQCKSLQAQDRNLYPDRIKTIQLFKTGDQTSFPALSLSSPDVLELHFDELGSDIKNYYYTFELCNADWSASILRSYEYIKGFQNNRITNYRNSSLATTRYIHYQAIVPDRNCYPSRSGNYLLKVFLDNDTAKTVFTKRLVVFNNLTSITAQVQQPFNAGLFQTGQKLNIAVQANNQVQVMSPADLKLVILQNNNWKTSLSLSRPTIYRGNYYEYNDEAYTAFPAGKEFRWIDMRSLRLLGDRMQRIDSHGDTIKVEARPDATRSGLVYVYYRDLNGAYTVETIESINPYWQGDYAQVHFTYVPPANKALNGSDVYLFGELTNYAGDTSGRMDFNAETGRYEKYLLLKQGYYSYSYAALPQKGGGYPDMGITEGNYWGTENSYIVLVYYRPFGARADELIGYTSVNSAIQR